MRLHHQSQGSGPPLILLHGFLGSGDNWQPVAAALAGRFRVLTPDLRNHGQSPHSPVMDYDAMAEDVHELMAEHGWDQALVAGHSMGGKTAMQFALRYPGKVTKLVVEDMAPREYAPGFSPVLAAMQALDPARFASRDEVGEALAPQIPSVILRRFLLKNLRRDAAGALQWRIHLDGLARNYAGLCAPLAPGRVYPGPALFVRGGQSDYVRAEDEPFIRQLFPQATLQTIAEAGHWVHGEALEPFLARLRDFL